MQMLVLAVATIHSAALHAETPSPCPKDNLDTCTRYQHLAADMDSGDVVVQLSSLRDASQELDPALRALIFGKALKSADLRVRTAGLRYILASRTRMAVVVDLPQHLNPAQEKAYQRLELLVISNIKLDDKTDEISATAAGLQAKGAIIRGGFEVAWQFCRLHMMADEEDMLRGTLRCQYPGVEPLEAKASIELS